MTRALICDPEMPGKAEAGKLDDIRACIACNQACIGHFHLGYPISCIQHPETGRELVYGKRKPIIAKKRIMVVGGGPGGMKAAAVAAERGHDVTLYEATEAARRCSHNCCRRAPSSAASSPISRGRWNWRA